jgi:hypothetical protein
VTAVNDTGKDGGNHRDNPGGTFGNGRVISYNLSEGERPGGMKVRYKLRIATGKRAREIDARQAAVIMEVLQWLSQHPKQP